jgi:hypothetical protein
MLSQERKNATEYYESKTKDLGANIQGLEAIIQGKTNNLRLVEEGKTPQSYFECTEFFAIHANSSCDLVLRQKVLASSGAPAQ